MELIADTSFLIGLWRRQEWAVEFAAERASAVIGIPWVVRGEFFHGARRAGHDLGEVERFLELGIPVNDPTPVVAAYARLCAELQTGAPGVYRQVGQNDLWIAATAIDCGLPLVTRNLRHFGAMEGLRVQTLQGD
ncbi:MAG: type II toxin-antitoxin system VapC family toxin [Opitutales bacterium]|nr:type II toxin-antitoxin system VapC family toxin [Opitutales bacterium]